MNFTASIPDDALKVEVVTTNGRGHSVDEVAAMCVKKLVHVSDTAPPVIRDQANAYSREVEKVVCEFMKQAVRSHMTTVYNAIKDAGQPELAEAIRRL